MGHQRRARRYLAALGLSDTRIGVVVTATLLGSAALTLFVGLRAHRCRAARLLHCIALLMIATGLGFAALRVLAAAGRRLRRHAQPDERRRQRVPADRAGVAAGDRPRRAAHRAVRPLRLLGSLVAAVGALCAGVPEWIGERVGASTTTALRWTFVGYAALGVVVLLRYRRLSPPSSRGGAPAVALGPSRRSCYRLAALFSLDAFGGGFVVTALVVLWLQHRFDLSLAVSGAVFFWAGVLSAFSALVAVRIAARIGLVRTMVFTHLPANGLLILAAFMPTRAVGRRRPACARARSRRWTCPPARPM